MEEFVPWQRGRNSIDNLRFGGFRYKNRAPQRTTTIVAAGSVFENDAAAWAREHLNFLPDCKQQQVLATNTRRGILNCTRQWGKSTTCAIKAVHYAHFHPESTVIVASPSQRQSSEFLRKAKKAVRTLGMGVRTDGDNPCSLLLPNGARIIGLPENEDTVRGFGNV